MGKKNCCVKGCGTTEQTRPKISIHCFPSAKHILKIWQDAIRNENQELRPNDKFVCSRHFTPNDYISASKLSPVATPTIFLDNIVDLKANNFNHNKILSNNVVNKHPNVLKSESNIEQPYANGKTVNFAENSRSFLLPDKNDLQNMDGQIPEETETVLIKEEILDDQNYNSVFGINTLLPPLAPNLSSINEIKFGEMYYENNKFKFKCYLCDAIGEDSKIIEQHFISKHLFQLVEEISSYKQYENNELEKIELKENQIYLSSKNSGITNELLESFTNEEPSINKYSPPEQIELMLINEPSQDKPTATDIQILKSQTKCNFCKLKLENNHKLRRHITQYRNKHYICNFCNKKHCGLRQFKKHIKLNHNTLDTEPLKEPLLFTCDICMANFKTLRNIKVHMRLHTNDLPFMCRECGKRFNNNSSLAFHFRHNHTTERPFQCSECGKCFSFLRILNAHIRQIHYKFKLNEDTQCKICSRQFRFKHELKRHMIVHTNIRPFTCNICKKSFKRRTVLINHSKLHSDDKLYKCQYCDQKFAQLAGRHWHIRQQHGK